MTFLLVFLVRNWHGIVCLLFIFFCLPINSAAAADESCGRNPDYPRIQLPQTFLCSIHCLRVRPPSRLTVCHPPPVSQSCHPTESYQTRVRFSPRLVVIKHHKTEKNSNLLPNHLSSPPIYAPHMTDCSAAMTPLPQGLFALV